MERFKNAPVTRDLWDDWLAMQQHPAVAAALGELVREYQERQEGGFASAELTTEEGVKKALKKQGFLEGMQRAFTILTQASEEIDHG